jgi:hypothetical protein
MEKTVFVEDERSNMTDRERNMQLSAALAVGPYVNYRIINIARTGAGGVLGWLITFLV